MGFFTAFNGRLGLADSRGLAHLSWSPRPAARLARLALRLPAGEVGSELKLRYSDHDVSDTWTRTIGRRTITSRAWVDGSRLIEQFGPFGVVSDVSHSGKGLRLVQDRIEFYGFRLPRRLSPQLRTRTWRTADSTLVSATTVRGPSGKLICRSVSVMNGIVAPTPASSGRGALRAVPSEFTAENHRELKLVG